jgi:hypothetical protein
MRSRALAAILLTLPISAAACQLVWSYDNFGDQPGPGGSGDDAGRDAGSDAEGDAESDAASDAESEDAGAANGLACEAGADCKSGNCEPGPGDAGGTVCCAASCGMCQTCDDDGETCELVPQGSPGAGCTGGVACDGAGTCKGKNGEPCPEDGGAAVCVSGICTSGTCCGVECPACKVCNKEGSGCANSGVVYDPRCMTPFKVCNGFGGCT